MALLYKKTPLFDIKIVYSYVIEVADSESDLGLFSTTLVSEIFAFYDILEYARGPTGRRGHVQLYTLVKIFYSNFFNNYESYEGYEGFEGF